MPVTRRIGKLDPMKLEVAESLIGSSPEIPDTIKKDIAIEDYPKANPRMMFGDKRPEPYVGVEGGRDVDDKVVELIARCHWGAGLNVEVRLSDGTMFFAEAGKSFPGD